MKVLKFRMWILAVVGCLLFSCNSDEPESDNPIIDNTYVELPEIIKAGDWTCRYYTRRAPSGLFYDEFRVSFLNDNFGQLKKESRVGASEPPYYHSIYEYYLFSYSLHGNQIMCTLRACSESEYRNFTGIEEIGEGEATIVTFEYIDGKLYSRTPSLQNIILGKDMLHIEGEGKFVEDQTEALKKVWRHENGLNILDLASPQSHAFQLRDKDHKFYDIYRRGDPINEMTYNYLLNSLHIIRIGGWEIRELTDNKLVIKTTNTKIVDTYYAIDPSEMPQLTDVTEILQSGYYWSNDNHNRLLFLKKDWSFLIASRGYGIGLRGTYSVEGNNLILEFNDETLSTSNVPRKMICPVTILDYDKIEIDYPDIGKRVLSAKIENADWAVGGAKRY